MYLNIKTGAAMNSHHNIVNLNMKHRQMFCTGAALVGGRVGHVPSPPTTQRPSEVGPLRAPRREPDSAQVRGAGRAALIKTSRRAHKGPARHPQGHKSPAQRPQGSHAKPTRAPRKAQSPKNAFRAQMNPVLTECI